MRTVLVVAPHPDDETLGCGGTLLRHGDEGAALHWLVATRSQAGEGVSRAWVEERERTIARVAQAYGMVDVHRFEVRPAQLDAVPLSELVASTSEVFEKVRPDVVYLPHPADAHSDHRRAFEMCASGGKWFRHPGVSELYAYETLSETGFGLEASSPFRATGYMDISATLERKLEILHEYGDELGDFPFPRSDEAVRALAALRGAEAGFAAAEAFQVLRLRR
jgi:LmbE family N-acetylglucosaminyl deacetylase